MVGFRTTRKVLGFDEVQLCHAGALLRVQIPATVANRKKHAREETPLFGDGVWLVVGCWLFLGGGLIFLKFSSLPGEMIQFDEHIFKGVETQPPTSYWLLLVWLLRKLDGCYFLIPPRYRVTNEWPVVWCEEKAGKAKSESKRPRLDGHQQPFQKGHVFTIPKRSQRIARKAHYLWINVILVML